MSRRVECIYIICFPINYILRGFICYSRAYKKSRHIIYIDDQDYYQELCALQGQLNYIKPDTTLKIIYENNTTLELDNLFFFECNDYFIDFS